jgi:hypothetical protein
VNTSYPGFSRQLEAAISGSVIPADYALEVIPAAPL